MVYQLIYTSASKPGMSETDLRMIANCASVRNACAGITGILLFFDGTILQVLEGERDQVTQLYAKIKADDRHTNVMTLIEREGLNREFSNWSMGFRNFTNTANSAALFNLTQNSLKHALPQDPSLELATLTRTYAKVSGL